MADMAQMDEVEHAVAYTTVSPHSPRHASARSCPSCSDRRADLVARGDAAWQRSAAATASHVFGLATLILRCMHVRHSAACAVGDR